MAANDYKRKEILLRAKQELGRCLLSYYRGEDVQFDKGEIASLDWCGTRKILGLKINIYQDKALFLLLQKESLFSPLWPFLLLLLPVLWSWNPQACFNHTTKNGHKKIRNFTPRDLPNLYGHVKYLQTKIVLALKNYSKRHLVTRKNLHLSISEKYIKQHPTVRFSSNLASKRDFFKCSNAARNVRVLTHLINSP